MPDVKLKSALQKILGHTRPSLYIDYITEENVSIQINIDRNKVK